MGDSASSGEFIRLIKVHLSGFKTAETAATSSFGFVIRCKAMRSRNLKDRCSLPESVEARLSAG
jgi:hypothetical protein